MQGMHRVNVLSNVDSPVVSTLLMLTVTTPVGWEASTAVINIELLQMHTNYHCYYHQCGYHYHQYHDY